MERTETPDLQAAAPEVALGLSSVGVTGVQKAVRIGRGRGEKLIAATIDCTVDLDPRQKGVHMSRFPELFEEAVEGVVEDDAFLVEDLAERVARRVLDRQEALVAEVRITARYPYERRTPVTKLATQEMVSLIGIAAASRERVRRVVFVEDSVRVALKSVLDELPRLDGGDFVLSRQVNFETIHAHEVVAERHGTIGELRAELEGGADHGPAAHTVLRDWLRA